MTELADEQGNGLRPTLEADYAASTSPELSRSFSQEQKRQHSEVRERNRSLDRFEGEARSSENLENTIRAATALHSQKAPEPAKVPALKPGAPANLSTTEKAEFDAAPLADRLAIKRAEAQQSTIEPQLAEYREIQESIAPAMDRIRKAGLTPAKAITSMMQWDAALSDPSRRDGAVRELCEQYGINLPSSSQAAPSPPPQFQQTYSELQGLPHFATVSPTMGSLLQLYGDRYERNGAIDYQALHRDAMKHHGLSDPAPSRNDGRRGKGLSVRETILAQVKQLRRA